MPRKGNIAENIIASQQQSHDVGKVRSCICLKRNTTFNLINYDERCCKNATSLP